MRRFAAAGVLAALALIVAATGAVASGNGASVNGGGSKDGLRAGKTDRPSAMGRKQRALVKEAAQAQAVRQDREEREGREGRQRQAGERASRKKRTPARMAASSSSSSARVRTPSGRCSRVRQRPATHNHGTLGTINHGGTPGPLHNQIPRPTALSTTGRSGRPNFNQSYYDNLLFSEAQGVSSMRNFYNEDSSDRYAVNGTVEDWVQLPNNEAAYGSNYCGDIVCSRDIQRLLEDGLNGWYAKQMAAGKTAAQINTYLSQFDRWDRYDYDGDGNFDEPDGYIDHFQAIHAGEGEETGGGAQGTDAIWSHRSVHNMAGAGSQGPDGNPFGGVRDRQLELLGRRLHGRARERRRGRVRPRVRPRPRHPGRVRHVRQHRRRRELDRLLDAVVERLVRERRHPGQRDRQPAVLDERVGQARLRLARLPERQARATARRRSRSARPRPRASRASRRPSSTCPTST